MPDNPNRRTVVVFGGAGALGAAVGGRLAADGLVVVAADALTPAEDARIVGVEYRPVDAGNEESVAAALSDLPAPLWGVVNVIGGYTPPQPVGDLDIGVLKQQLELNLVTAAIVTKHAVGALTERQTGRIVHTSSRAAIGDGARTFAYSVSKLAVIRLVESTAAEVRDLGITVNCILPSVIDTPANRAAMPSSDHDRWPKPDELAAVVSFLVSDDSAIVSGASIPVYGLA